MDRYLSSFIKQDADKKIILISGPRQCGKTTLIKTLFKTYEYFNYDSEKHKALILSQKWNRDVDAVLFDELHKMKNWKRWLKGIYDTEDNRPRLIVTGSANLEAFRHVGDSLAGRYFRFRMHPIDIKEGCQYFNDDAQEIYQRLMTVSGFPEPFLKGDEKFYRRWQQSHLDIILRQDFLDLYAIRSLKSLELLFDLLKHRIASPISHANLASDLQVEHKTVKNWLLALENIYAIFSVTPYHKNIARSSLKEPKYYFYDIPRVEEQGARLENLVACALLKEINFVEDTMGHKGRLHYLKTKDKAEIDFLVVIDEKPIICVEVKATDDNVSPHFKTFQKFLGDIAYVQLVVDIEREYDTPNKIKVRKLAPFLRNFNLSDYLHSKAIP